MTIFPSSVDTTNDISKLFAWSCKATKLYGLYLYCGTPPLLEDESVDIAEVSKAAPYLLPMQIFDLCISGFLVLFFKTEEELNIAYGLTIGDDGATELNDYKGPANIYAMTCHPNGQIMTENT